MVVMTCVVIESGNKNDRRILIIKRSQGESEGPGLWTIPGGKVEITDWERLKKPDSKRNYFTGAFNKTCRRELKEETGLVTNRFHYLAGQEVMFIRSTGQPTVVLSFWTQQNKWRKAHLKNKSNL